MGIVQEINFIKDRKAFVTQLGVEASSLIGKSPKMISFIKYGTSEFGFTSATTTVELFNFKPEDYSHIIIDFMVENKNTQSLPVGDPLRYGSHLVSLSYLSTSVPTANPENGFTYDVDNISLVQTSAPLGTNPTTYLFPIANQPLNGQMTYNSESQTTRFSIEVKVGSTIKGIAKLM